MSIAGIATSILSQLSSPQTTNSAASKQTQIQAEFQQLAQDLQAGNLSQARTDFAALQQNAPAGQTKSTSPLSQAFSALGKDLQSGNVQAAQQDFANIQQDVANLQQAAQGQVHHHHHHHAAAAQNSGSTQPPNSIAQLFSALGQDLQNGSLSGAQQAYAALQQDLPFLSASSGSTVNSAAVSSLSVNA